ncbi:hypothetical protein [Micromonospora sp. HUAS LYJ1]|uniref:hypothetical protein n=1 Tax=Micromonospora sp. HUAS LYJ1 TaxID=3061626 RepID=UPI002671E720|nr:hypothetical protein [Micromonospora sp. HUAS LYJ1]WKU02721.1 hypothetical protein Q2K16_17545 [Micromonospora sp. HUAS LYJ1]
MRSSALVLVAVTAAAALLTGCSAAEPGTPAPPAATTAPTPTGSTPTGAGASPDDPDARSTGVDRVTLTRSGGFAGNRDTVTVEPDGRWTTTDRAGARRTGRLDAAALDRLLTLTGPATRADAGGPADDGCADTYRYQLTVGTHRVDWTDCPTGPQPSAAAQELAALLLKTTTTG